MYNRKKRRSQKRDLAHKMFDQLLELVEHEGVNFNTQQLLEQLAVVMATKKESFVKTSSEEYELERFEGTQLMTVWSRTKYMVGWYWTGRSRLIR